MTKIASGSYLQSLATNNGGGDLNLIDNKCYTYSQINTLTGFSISSVLDSNQLVKESLISYNSAKNVEITINGTCTINNSGSTFLFRLLTSEPVDTDLTIVISFSYGSDLMIFDKATATIQAGFSSGVVLKSVDTTSITVFNLSSASISPTSSSSQTYSYILGTSTIVDNRSATTITWKCEDSTATGLMQFAWFEYSDLLTEQRIYNQLTSQTYRWPELSAVIDSTVTVTTILANSAMFDGSTTSIDVSGTESTSWVRLKVVTYKNNPTSVEDVSIQDVTIIPGRNNTITLPAIALVSQV